MRAASPIRRCDAEVVAGVQRRSVEKKAAEIRREWMEGVPGGVRQKVAEKRSRIKRKQASMRVGGNERPEMV